MEPQGPLDPQIYWRRRLAAGGGALVLLIVLIIIIAVSCGSGSGSDGGPDESDAAAAATTTSAAAATTEPEKRDDPESTTTSATAEPKDEEIVIAGRCADGMIGLTVTPDAAGYQSGASPKFVVAITNLGITDCDVDLSEHLRPVTVTTLAGDPIWSLWDCNEPVGEDVRSLKPGEQVKFETEWAGTTSVTGCTPADRQPVAPGEYAVTGHLGTITSPPATFNVS